MNMLDKLPKRQQGEAKLMLRAIPYAETRADAERLRTAFSKWCRDRSYDAASETLERDWDRMTVRRVTRHGIPDSIGRNSEEISGPTDLL